MNKESINKYRPFTPVKLEDREWPNKTLSQSPIWCSVDLRDGNQALPIPMSVEEKLEYFQLLVEIGFKQIEIGFPSASDTEYNFARRLVEENLVPKDVKLQVLVQAREHLIKKTFEAIDGLPSAIVHLYNSTSPLQRKITFNNASREEIKKIATEGTQIVKDLVPTIPNTVVDFQYSPESFSDTEMDYALEVCEAVIDIWKPTKESPCILNLPATVEWTTPNVHADQIEWFCKNISQRENIHISLHTHNDRGTGVAATELGILAGADRVEGTLFGNGERTGNLDIITVALNLNSHGIETGLDFSNLPKIKEVYERTTKLVVPERLPYAGELVFTAFSGSHQDAIKKGMDLRTKALKTDPQTKWGVPYLTIDPEDIGRNYESIVRINSQSGKGGIAYILDREHGLELPKTMHPYVGNRIAQVADEKKRELTSAEIIEIFESEFCNLISPLEIETYELNHTEGKAGEVSCEAVIVYNNKKQTITGSGNGPINAFVSALKTANLKNFTLTDYRSHAVKGGSSADAAAYVQLKNDQSGEIVWGAGLDPSIEMAGIKALVTSYNLIS